MHIGTMTALGALAVVSAGAAGQTFTSRTAFETAAGGAGIPLNLESFEGLPLASGSADTDEIVTDAFTLTAVNEGFTFLPPLAVLGTTGPGGTFATEGVQHVNVGSLFNSGLNNNVIVTFTFNETITAFAVDITDLLGLDQAENPQATLTTDAGDVITLLDGQGTNPLIEAGVINAAGFTTVTITSTAGDSFGLDNVAFGIPTPSTLAMLGLGGLVAARRRR